MMFLDAVEAYGLPSRVRGDRGGENKDVPVFMIILRGVKCASFMWGSSTHNTQIERLWVEVGMQFTCSWHAFFFHLERLHHLDRTTHPSSGRYIIYSLTTSIWTARNFRKIGIHIQYPGKVTIRVQMYLFQCIPIPHI